MAHPVNIPTRRSDLLLGPCGEQGGYTVSDPHSGNCFRLGEQEAFLFSHLDGRHTAAGICAAFAERFGDPLTEDDLREFLDLAGTQGFLQSGDAGADAGGPECAEEIAAYSEAYAASGELFRRAQRVIGGATTHDRRGFGPFPVYVDRAKGVYKWDVTGRRLIDYWMGHGSLLLGHSYPPVVEAVAHQAARGTHYGACHEAEVRWAELVCALIPSAERVRFTASGTEATLLALRVARAFTGRERVLKFHGHFHGWHDEAMSHFYPQHEAGFSPGAVANVAVANDADPAAVEALLEQGDIAAVLLEPGGGTSGGLPWSTEFLRRLRELTTAHGTLLIFDEVISGFRWSPGGVQELCGVLPDLTTLAKILCGGLPGGAVAGRAEVMAVFGPGTRRGDRLAKVPHTGTYNGNPLSAAAGIALLERVADGAAQQTARAAAGRLAALVNEAAEANGVDVHLYTNDSSVYHMLIGARAAGYPLGASAGMAHLHHGHPGRYARLRRSLLLEGVDSPPLHGWVSAVHDSEVVEATARAFDRAFGRLRGAEGFRREA
jgi:glutamate-1-semialdehyde 2,1-aminomutase